MNILSRVTWKAMWKNKTRTIVTIIGVILSAALFTAVITAAVSGMDYLMRGEIYDLGDFHIGFYFLNDREASDLKNREDVTDFADYQALGYFYFADYSMPLPLVAGNEALYQNMPVHLVEGRLPENSGEILLPAFYEQSFADKNYPYALGETITLDFTTAYEDFPRDITETREFTRTFTIVGFADPSIPSEMWGMPLLTAEDSETENVMWHNVYVKLSPPRAAYNMGQEPWVGDFQINDDLLQLMGQTETTNLNDMMFCIVAALCVIILIGSVSLIYNAFSISVTERTKQFGLLSSVGATKRQLRHSVLFEALSVSAIGIPLGICLGLSSTALVLHLVGGFIENLFSFSTEGPIRLEMVFFLPAVLSAAAIALVTVLLSAWLPARRATRVTPLEAIRQTGDYQVKPKQLRGGKITARLFGLPGTLAQKYFSVSRKKYRATVVSLATSVALFMSAMYVGTQMSSAVESSANIENFDINASAFPGETDELEALRRQDFVSRSAFWYSGRQYLALVDEDMYTQEMLDIWDDVFWMRAPAEREQLKRLRYVDLYYLEDEVFRAYLEEHGMDSAPYFAPDCPTALLCNLSVDVNVVEDGVAIRKIYPNVQILKDGVEQLPLFPYGTPETLEDEDRFYSEPHANAQGDLYWQFASYEGETGPCYLVREEGADSFGYYPYDPDTGITGDAPAATYTVEMPNFRLDKRTIELPYGIAASQTTHNGLHISAILPLSTMPEAEKDELMPNLSVSVSDYPAAKHYLEDSKLLYTDYLEDEQTTRGLVITVNLFAYCFIAVISLICVANVFNTISTNIALRRRDFGMLKSVGMKVVEIRRMMAYECLIYGLRALIWGIPIGVLCSYGGWRIFATVYSDPFVIPWRGAAIASVSVFAVVFASMAYAVRKLRNDNPIDAIRQENL